MNFSKALENIHEERDVQAFYLLYTYDRIIGLGWNGSETSFFAFFFPLNPFGPHSAEDVNSRNLRNRIRSYSFLFDSYRISI